MTVVDHTIDLHPPDRATCQYKSNFESASAYKTLTKAPSAGRLSALYAVPRRCPWVTLPPYPDTHTGAQEKAVQ